MSRRKGVEADICQGCLRQSLCMHYVAWAVADMMRPGPSRLVTALSGLAVFLGGVGSGPGQAIPRDTTRSKTDLVAAPECAPANAKIPIEVATSTSAPRHNQLSEALRKGFGVQYWGQGYSAEELASAPHGLLILEATKVGATYSADGLEVLFTADEIRKIRRDGTRPVLGYINVAEIEDYRDYWAGMQTAPADPAVSQQQTWIGPRTPNAEHLANYWTPEWEAILARRVAVLMSLGLDGIFLDDVLHYYTFAAEPGLDWTGVDRTGQPAGAPGHARAMMSLVERLASQSRAENCNAIVIVNNGVFIGRDAGPDAGSEDASETFGKYLGVLDAVLVEGVFASEARAPAVQALKEDYFDKGVEVLALDFATQFPDQSVSAVREKLSRRADEAGFTSYLADDGAFDRLYPPITRMVRVRAAK